MISIQNVYYLLLYAWDALEDIDDAILESEPEAQVLDLLASVLNRGVDRLLRQGLDRRYVPQRETIAGIRGKLDVSATVKSDLTRRSQAVCEFDELTHDVLQNRLIKATLRHLLRTIGIAKRLREPLRATSHRLHEVSDVSLDDTVFRRLRRLRLPQPYRLVLDVCRLLHKCLIPTSGSDEFTFRSFLRDERRMRLLFERFIRNFYRRHADGFSVDAESLRWENTTGTVEHLAFLPRMRTDVTLRRPNYSFIIDAKYYVDTLQRYRGGGPTVRSPHLYQLFAYMKNAASRAGTQTRLEGMLLYPLTTHQLSLRFQMHGHLVRVCTIDLNQHWSKIHADLLALLPA